MTSSNAGRKRLVLLLLCVIVGLLAGLASVAMHELAARLTHAREALDAEHPLRSMWLAPLFPAVGILGCVVFAKVFFRRRGYDRSLGTAIRAVRHRVSSKLPSYHAFTHILTSGFAVGMGISAGMEAPSAITGAAIGSKVGRFFKQPRETASLLLCAGAAAGIGAIFQAPLAGALFACEVLLPGVSASMLVPLLISAASGMAVSLFFSTHGPFPTVEYQWSLHNVWAYLSLGLLCALCSWGMISANTAIGRLAGRVKNDWLRGLTGCLILGIVLPLFPALSGQGYDFIGSLLLNMPAELPTGIFPSGAAGNLGQLITMTVLLMLLKPAVSMISLQSGGDGGMFGPSLTTGAFLGYAFYLVLNAAGITGVPAINCVAAGMAGVLAGVMHAPLTGLFLIAEILHSYTMMLPLMFVVAISAGISKFITRKNLYMTSLKSKGEDDDDVETLDELEKLPVREFADTGYSTVRTSDTFQSLLNVMMSTHQTIFPVLDRKGLLMGVVDEGDIRPLIAETGSHWSQPVEDIMSPPPCAIQETTPIGKVAEMFEQRTEDIFPLVDVNGKFTAMISRTQILDNYRHYIYSKLWVDNQ